MSTYPLRVALRRDETEESVSFWFDVPVDLRTAFDYRTGQFLSIEEELAGQSVVRQYSLASVPTLDDRLQITVKRINGGLMSTWLVNEVSEGDILEVESPRGRLYVPHDEPRHILCLAAGSGIVPLYAIAREGARLIDDAPEHRVTLVYGNRHEESIIMRDDVDRLAGLGIAVDHVLSRPGADWTGSVGHVDAAYLEEHWEALTADGTPLAVYLCGPEDFMANAEAWLVVHGVALDDIRKESFDLVLNDDESEPDLLVPTGWLDHAEPEECFQLTAVLGGEEIEVTPEPGERLLSALLRVSDEVPFSCQEGTCSSCIVKVREGRVGVRPQVLATLRPADLEEGLILACLSRAQSESVRIDFDDI